MKSITIPLKEAIVLGDKTYTELTLHPLKAKHFKYLPSEFFDDVINDPSKMDAKQSLDLAIKIMPLIAGLSNVSEEVVGELSFNDLMEVVTNIGPFLEMCLKTGNS